MGKQVMHLEESLLIFLSVNIVLNQLLMTYHFIHRSMHLSSTVRGASVCSSWLLTRRRTTGKGTENKGPQISLKSTQTSHVYLRKLGIVMEEGAERL